MRDKKSGSLKCYKTIYHCRSTQKLIKHTGNCMSTYLAAVKGNSSQK